MDKKEITKIIAFFAMSDGSLACPSKGPNGNAYFRLSMSERNMDILSVLTPALDAIGVSFKIKTFEIKGGKYFDLCTKRHPSLTRMYHRIYFDGHRIPSQHDFKLLDWQAVAILYMCDGNIQKAGKKWYPMLNLCRWDYSQLSWVQHQFKDTLSLDTSIYKCGKYWRMGVPVKHIDYFFENVKQYMTPSFSYKLPYGKPQDILGDDIVRAVGKLTDVDRNDLHL